VSARACARVAGLLACALALAGCDAPTVPARTGAYPFALQTVAGEVVMRWPAGGTVRVAVAPGGAAASNLQAAVTAGAAQWNAVALYGEYELVRVSDVADADVVVAGSDVPLPVDVSACPPSSPGFGLTTFCLSPDGRSLTTFPLAGGGGHIRMVVTVLASFATDGAAARRVVAHELGHVLGIARHSPNPADLMAAAAPTDRPGPADVATVLALYHTPATVVP